MSTGSEPANPLTFDGAREAMQRDIALNTTAEQRIHWLEQALRIATESGAIACLRAREDAELNRLWRGARAGVKQDSS